MWMPIETAPKDGSFILVFTQKDFPDFQSIWVAQHEDGIWWVHGRECTPSEPTHWQPLPEPPK